MQPTSQGAGPKRRRPAVVPRSAVAPPPETAAATRELRAVIDAMPEPVLVCDASDSVTLANPAADRLFAGRPVRDAGDLLTRFEPDAAGAFDVGVPVIVHPRTAPHRWFELRNVPFAVAADRTSDDDGAGGRVIVLHDVTAARQARAERRAFLSILSHELRTPITTIYAGSRVLARQDPLLGRNAPEIAQDISAEAARLYDVVEDLLVLTRVEQDLLELLEEPILLQRVAESAIRVARGRVPDVPVIVESEGEPAAVRGDILYVDQVVRNLVTAATRFGGPEAPIVIRIEEGDGEVSLSVTDPGPELSADDMESAFALGDDGDPRGAGVGIGMFVCGRLIEAMNGRVWARRPAAGGAEYGFSLPRYDPD